MVKDLKGLKKFLQLCRQQGVESIRIEGLEVHLGALPTKAYRSRKPSKSFMDTMTPPDIFVPGGVMPEEKIETDELSDEELLFYSSQGHVQPSQPS